PMWFTLWWPFWWWSGAPKLRVAEAGDAQALSLIHAQGFAHPWSAMTIESMLAERTIASHVIAASSPEGFIIARCVADEAEIITVAVARASRGKGYGRRLLDASLDELVRRRVRRVFLEVEAENAAAIHLYRQAGFERIGQRRGYYRQADGSRRDAVTMALNLESRPLVPALDG
ncbi:MAG TPA: ribosomal protein S18-alanine N-acetyltransferase, partial [Beijerinckiaceae bacterium]|nr:ribosomal protein S18-alanine N-acetyltransferase [Beijerinckiaceae bacterium]